jgi:hypothetical protein
LTVSREQPHWIAVESAIQTSSVHRSVAWASARRKSTSYARAARSRLWSPDWRGRSGNRCRRPVRAERSQRASRGVAQQRLHDCHGQQLRVGQLRRDPHGWPPAAQLRAGLQGVVDGDVQGGSEVSRSVCTRPPGRGRVRNTDHGHPVHIPPPLGRTRRGAPSGAAAAPDPLGNPRRLESSEGDVENARPAPSDSRMRQDRRGKRQRSRT